jgi:hypothetical protein
MNSAADFRRRIASTQVFALSQWAEHAPNLWLDTAGPKWMDTPLPLGGEGGPPPEFFSRGGTGEGTRAYVPFLTLRMASFG